MKRPEPQLLADIIKEKLMTDGIEPQFNEQRVLYLWQEVVGPGVNRYTTRRFIDRGVLHIYISSASLKNELSFLRAKLIDELNKAVGAKVVTEIQFH
ncbi:DUF721 domain-containing protein [Barnesiella sp. WM24]|uniref:DciA family protein n=1 Tax=Barnesiella sp. WM24 TaxID=2558278 RepID=UPI0010720BA2|nr:DUF721 domain-containing protein [Barnesiella sp. WM24]TFU92483.1 DUF721 domain-containing protein [Barnesiella sp. WM24]